ncbi:bactofilin family protein [Halovivax limisalsi]|uniref:bactofilin family protein n=1 Tax=Halovivax limisalsi TaxID=1453760 RepID=UPI001FFD21D9|nr:polymer-forming cytoskeletal protein [Halovivax limisalsi]
MRRSWIGVLCFLVAGLALSGATAAAAPADGSGLVSTSGFGGSIVVEEGETVSSVEGVAGGIVVDGTVEGDVSGLAGDVRIRGTVDGDVSVATGNLYIDGTVTGDVSAGAGSIRLAEGGEIRGSIDAGAGTVRIDGTIGGDATIGAETITLGESASIDGDLTYDGTLAGNTDAVEGSITHDSTLGMGLVGDVQPLASWLFAIYAFVLNLVLGAVLLAVAPRFTAGVAGRARRRPLRTGAVGFGVLIAVPVVLVAVALTVVGIPLSLIGALLFALVVWIGLVLGRFALGVWVLSLVDVERPWLALLLGLAIGAFLSLVPWLGGVIDFVLLLLGLGGLAIGLYTSRRRSGPPAASPRDSTPAS